MSGSTTSTASVATSGAAARWLYAEWSAIASARPGTNAAGVARPARSSIATLIIANVAVTPPCMTAVPKPRTIHVASPASGTSRWYWRFSTIANPAPTAKPRIAASTRNPTRWARISATITRPFASSSTTGPT